MSSYKDSSTYRLWESIRRELKTILKDDYNRVMEPYHSLIQAVKKSNSCDARNALERIMKTETFGIYIHTHRLFYAATADIIDAENSATP